MPNVRSRTVVTKFAISTNETGVISAVGLRKICMMMMMMTMTFMMTAKLKIHVDGKDDHGDEDEEKDKDDNDGHNDDKHYEKVKLSNKKMHLDDN